MATDSHFESSSITDIFWLDGPVLLFNRHSYSSEAGRRPVLFVSKTHKTYTLTPSMSGNSSYCGDIIALAPDHKSAVIRLKFVGPWPGNPWPGSKENEEQSCWTSFLDGKLNYLPANWCTRGINADFTAMVFQEKRKSNPPGQRFSPPLIHMVRLKDGKIHDAKSSERYEAATKFYNFREQQRGPYSELYEARYKWVGLDDTFCVREIIKNGKQFVPDQLTDNFALAREDKSLWLLSLLAQENARCLTTKPASFAILSNGDCIYSDMSEWYVKDQNAGTQSQVEGAFYYDYKQNSSYDLWQDFPIIKPVATHFDLNNEHYLWHKDQTAEVFKTNSLPGPESSSIRNRRFCRIMPAFGSDKFPPLAFLQLRQEIVDLDARPHMHTVKDELRVRDYLLNGKVRHLIPLSEDWCPPPKEVALVHKSGTLVTEEDKWINHHKIISLHIYNWKI